MVADLTLRFGDEKSLKNRRTAGQLAGAMLMRGTTKRTRQQIQDEFDRLKARVNVGGAATSANASIETDAREPAGRAAAGGRDPARAGVPGRRVRAAPPAAAGRPRGAARATRRPSPSLALQRHMRPHAERRRPLRADDRRIDRRLKRASTLDDVKQFHADFYGASNGELSVVGRLRRGGDPEAGHATCSARLEVAAAVTRAWATRFEDVAAVNQSFETPDKANAFFIGRASI